MQSAGQHGCNRPVSIFDATWYWLHYNPFAPDGAEASYACGIASFGATDRDATDWAGYVRDAAAANPERWPPVSIWQGTGDATVDPDNLRELTEQWTAVQGIDSVPDDREKVGDAVVRDLHYDDAGTLHVETWSLKDFSHAVPIDTDGDPAVCGFEADFILNADICAVRRLADFWQLR
jgi:poly(3-hydroxybutyrate) depolymerase